MDRKWCVVHSSWDSDGDDQCANYTFAIRHLDSSRIHHCIFGEVVAMCIAHGTTGISKADDGTLMCDVDQPFEECKHGLVALVPLDEEWPMLRSLRRLVDDL